MKKITFIIAILFAGLSIGQTIKINEVDADQTSTDTEEFIEILSENPSQSLDGYIVVLYNGSNDLSYTTVDLNGFTTDANGFFIIGSDAVSGVDIPLGADNTIQNGADAIAIYQDSAANFPNGTPVTNTNLIDAIVYGTSDDDDAELLAGLGQTTQYDENLNGNKDTESLQRKLDNTFCTALPTLRAENACPDCSFVITNTIITCDTQTSGQDSVTIEVEYAGAGDDTYTVAITSGGGVVGGDDPTSVAEGTITLTAVSENTTITLGVTSTFCNISEDITTPVCEPANQVSSIADLRAGTIGNVYILTTEALVTFAQNFRNQKFIEDNTGAILIDDDNEIITSTYAIGDGVTGLKGMLDEHNGMLQFIPEEDPGSPSSNGNTITAQDVSISDLNANPENYESEYVEITSAVMVDNSTNATWDVGTVYELSNADGTFNFRTSFYGANYIDQLVPTTAVVIAGIITERENDGSFYITARDNNDANTILGTNNNTNTVFSVYPNPANDYVNISSKNSGEITVSIFNILGKQVINTTIISERLNIANLTTGVYLMNISQNGISSTKKLVVR